MMKWKSRITVGVVMGVLFIGVGASLLYRSYPPKAVQYSSDIISKDGIHWHPHLAIYIKGQQQEIPADIGIGTKYRDSKWYDPMMAMTDFHTHDTGGTLHWEVMEGPVTKEHVQLKAFFDIWGKPFTVTQIFDHQNGLDGKVSMTVNGQPNTDYQNYMVRDGDTIVIKYE